MKKTIQKGKKKFFFINVFFINVFYYEDETPTVFKLQNKLLKNMLIYYYYQILKIHIMF